ncbi:MAG: MFS transporter [Bacteroidota bacterium]
MTQDPTAHDTFASLRIRDFRFFLGFRFLLTFAVQMQGVIVGWQIYALTDDALSLGMIGLAEALPYVGTSLFGGHVADVFNRKRVNVVCSLLFFVCSVAMLTVTNYVSDDNQAVWLFYVIIFATGIARGFLAPSVSALFAQIVPRSLYVNGSAWNTNVWQSAAVAGPAFGGLLYGWFGVMNAYLVVIACAGLSIIMMLMIPTYPIPVKPKREGVFRSIGEGIRFVLGNQIILAALTLDLVAVLFGGAVAVLPIFASKILHTGPEGLGYLRAAPFLGSVVMGVFIASRRPMRHAGLNMLCCVAAFGLCNILFACSELFWWSFFLLFMSGVFDNVSVVIRATILQLMTPDEMRGRVSAVNNIFVGSSNEIGAFESGLAAKLLGLIPSVVLGGSVAIVSVFVAYWKAPDLRKLDLRKL